MSSLTPTQVAKRKQILLFAGIGISVLVMAGVGVHLSFESGPPPGVTRKADIKTKSYIAPGEKVDPQDAWRGVSDTRLSKLEDELAKLQSDNTRRQRELEAAGKAKPGNAPELTPDDELDRRLKEFEKRAATSQAYPQEDPSQLRAKSGGPAPAQKPSAQPAQQAQQVARQPAGPAAQGQATPVADTGNFETVRLRPAAPDSATRSPGGGQPGSAAAADKNEPKTTENYFPSGSFGRAVILSGLDAPTGGQAQSNPQPVLLELLDPAVLPNKYRHDWKHCRITGAGYGDISSERATIRTESLSCVGVDGRVLDIALKGYISGEDGKAGVRGRLVSKQGQALANALLAGVVSGIGHGLEKSSTTQSISPLGSTTTVKPGSEYKAGVGEGVGKALDRLANYYIQLAEKMFPVIEVDAGRVVDVVLMKGAVTDVDLQ